jgi:hypothetical protein
MGLTTEQLYAEAYSWHLTAPHSGSSQAASWHFNCIVAERTYTVQMVFAYTKYDQGEPEFDTKKVTLTYDDIRKFMGDTMTVRAVLHQQLLVLFKEAGIDPPPVLRS